MKALILATIVVATAVHAQQSTPCLKLTKVKVDNHVLHQTDTTQLHLTFVGQHCYVFRGSLGRPNEWPFIDFKNVPGMVIESTHGLDASRLDQSSDGAKTFRAQELSGTFNVTAVSGLELGEYKIPGEIHYKVVDSQGTMSNETLAFEIPLKVKESKPESFSDEHPVWARILLPLEIVALFPLWILAGLISGENC
ncbi:MAG TPA: hypothetical protein VKH81_20025 [Candidatus Angelobacter sp.]|nr:hypothetical protein [Candidatus Angelobacter sp.]